MIDHDAQRLSDAQALDEAYASATGSAEAFDRDLLALVNAAHDVVSQTLNEACPEIVALKDALEQFEPWLDGDEDPRSMGWVDDRGLP